MHSRSFVPLGLCLACCTPAFAQTAGDTARASASFNPRTSLILQGTFADFGSDLEPEVPGVLLGPETELRPGGFSLAETELVMEANVDDQFRGWATIALENEDGETVVAVEEAYVSTLALPAGLGLKAGRFFSDIGYQNRIHSHAWEFVDLPIVYRALLAKQLKDDGVQLRWVAPTDLFVELGVEALRGAGFPAGGEERDGANSWTAFAHFGGDIGIGGAWRLGLSHLAADADGRATFDEDSPETFTFTGDSAVSIVDFVFKWAQDGNPARRNFVLNAEYFHRDEDGTVDFDDGVNPTVSSDYDGTQRGFYVQSIYQFMPRWRAGLRYDRLEADNTVANNPAGEFDTLAGDDAATRISAMLDFSNSEFSRIRVQYSRDESRPGGEEDDQFFVQYIMSLGSHAAHQF
ncbi:MAG: TonB-dependent receptor [Gammaproteobacteria bacterium]